MATQHTRARANSGADAVREPSGGRLFREESDATKRLVEVDQSRNTPPDPGEPTPTERVSRGSRWQSTRCFVFDPYELRFLGPNEIDDVIRVRFRRYVLEQGKQYPNAVDGRLEDRLDEVSLNLALYLDDQLVTAVRLSWLDDISAADYLSPLKIALAESRIANTIVCSRLVAEPGVGSMRATILLFIAAYYIGLDSSGERSLLSTSPARRKSFAAIGFRDTQATFSSPIFGEQSVMLLNMADRRIARRYDRLLRSISPGTDRRTGASR